MTCGLSRWDRSNTDSELKPVRTQEREGHGIQPRRRPNRPRELGQLTPNVHKPRRVFDAVML